MKDVKIVVLAGGQGKRMGEGNLPKVLSILKSKSLIEHLLESVNQVDVKKPTTIVVGYKSEMVKEKLGQNYDYVLQAEQLGTGHAVMMARELLEGKAGNILVLYGDQPFMTVEAINKIIDTHLSEGTVMTMGTVEVEDFEDWRQCFSGYGRIVRDEQGNIEEIVEKKDATEEQLKITEVNPAYFCFRADWMWQCLSNLKNNNNQNEYYLTDLVGMAFDQKEKIASVKIDPRVALGVNTQEQLLELEKLT